MALSHDPGFQEPDTGASIALDGLARALDLHAAVSVTDPEGVIQEVNDRFCAISGYARDDLIGATHAIINSGRHPSAFFAEMWREIGAGRPWRGEICNRRRDGGLYWVDSLIAPVRDASGRIVRFISVRHDVTRYKTAMADLEAIRARQNRAAELSRVGVWSYRPDDDVFLLDDTAAAIHGAEAGFEPTRDEALAFLPEDARSEVDAALRACLDTGDAFDVETPFLRLDGRQAHVRVLGGPVLVDGAIVGASGALQDISLSKEREEATARLQARFEAIVSNVPAAIALKDRQGTLHFANPGYEALVGRRNLFGMVEGDLFPDVVADLRAARDAAVFESGGARTTEDEIEPGDGAGARTLLTSRFLVDDPVLGERLVCEIGADITEQKTLQTKLEAARAEAEAATAAKASFLATMSHEIRTPMNGVLGMAEALARTELGVEQRRMLDTLRRSGEMMVRLLNDILDFSKIESRRIELESAVFDPVALARDVIDVHRARAESKGLAIAVEVAAGAGGARLGDPLRVQQILHNLVGNAVKFTERGSVRVAVAGHEGTPLVFRVADTGLGMTPDQAARVFERFAQADPDTARKFGGTGLGLAIVRSLSEAMGGAVTLDSAPGEGSVFTATLPLPSASPLAEGARAAVETPTLRPGLRALAADDNEVNRMVMAAFLDGLGVEATVVDGGKPAVAAAREQDFDILLFDILMPDMDGPDALARIHAEMAAAGRRPPPAVAVTGHASDKEIAECRARGFAAHLAKPLKSDALARTIARMTAPIAAEKRPAPE